MANALLIFGVLALFHFLYEGVLAPSLRLKLRYDLFALRDRARGLKMIDKDLLDDSVYSTLEDYLNTAIKVLPRTNLQLIAEARTAFQSDPALRAQAEKRFGLLESCPSPEVQMIRKRAAGLLAYALLANSGGWFVYLVPIALVIAFFSRINVLLRNLLFVPGHQLDQLFPEAIAY